MMHSELIGLAESRTTTTHSEANDVQGYVAPVIVAVAVGAGMFGLMGVWLNNAPLGAVIEQAVQDLQRL